MTETIQRRDSAAIAIRAKTLDETNRTVDAVISTDQPVEMWDYRTDDVVNEILPPAAMVVRGGGDSVPLLDAHSRNESDDIVGRVTDLRAEGSLLIATLRFDDDEKSQRIFKKVKSGSLTDISIGYSVKESRYLEDGDTVIIDGRSYVGPAKVATRYELQEASTVPIGADHQAKIRELKDKSGNSAGAKPKTEEGQSMTENPKAPVVDTPEKKAPVAPAFDERKAQAEADKRALEQYQALRSIAKEAEIDSDKVDEFFKDGKTADEFRAFALDELVKRSKPAISDPDGVKIEQSTDQRDKKRAALTDGLLLRAGTKIDKPAEGANDFRSHSLLDMARTCLEESGVNHSDVSRMSRDEVFKRALNNRNRDTLASSQGRAFNHSTSDFPLILADAMNKNLQNGYTLANTTWQEFCSVGSVSDFKNKKVLKLSDGKVPEKILENGEIPESNYSEDQEQYRAYTYGQIISITRETLINDDLSAFSRIPSSIAAQFARLVEMKVYSLLLANSLGGSVMADGVNLFHADHNNLTGTGTAVSVAALQVANALMAKQTGPNGSLLNIRPESLICGPEIAGTVAQVINSTVDPSKSNSAVNPYANSLKVISSPYLTTAFTFDGTIYNPATTDTNHWYLAGNPNQIDTIEVSFLNGVNAPSIEEEEGFETLGMKLRAYMDFGAAPIDHRGLYRNAGA